MASAKRSRRPYLLRAMHEWITDCEQTPHVVVDAEVPGVEVPRQYVKDGKIVLNVSHSATSGLVLGNDWVEFSARFSGVTRQVRIPVRAVLGIYARESGQGMIFSDSDVPDPGTPPPGPGTGEGKRPRLKVVK